MFNHKVQALGNSANLIKPSYHSIIVTLKLPYEIFDYDGMFFMWRDKTLNFKLYCNFGFRILRTIYN